MAKPRTSEPIWVRPMWASLLCAMATLAMPTHAQELVRDLIDSQKMRMSQDMLEAARPPADQQRQQRREQLANVPPRLWSLSGAQGQVVAEIIWSGQVLRVPLRANEPVTGGWRVQSFNESGITLVDKSSGRRQHLPAPTQGLHMAAYMAHFPQLLSQPGEGVGPQAR